MEAGDPGAFEEPAGEQAVCGFGALAFPPLGLTAILGTIDLRQSTFARFTTATVRLD